MWIINQSLVIETESRLITVIPGHDSDGSICPRTVSFTIMVTVDIDCDTVMFIGIIFWFEPRIDGIGSK